MTLTYTVLMYVKISQNLLEMTPGGLSEFIAYGVVKASEQEEDVLSG